MTAALRNDGVAKELRNNGASSNGEVDKEAACYEPELKKKIHQV